VQEKTHTYKRFQDALTRWRALHREGEEVLEKIRELSTEQYE
jgi:hypothetical protein